jgi:hypothetical protein
VISCWIQRPLHGQASGAKDKGHQTNHSVFLPTKKIMSSRGIRPRKSSLGGPAGQKPFYDNDANDSAYDSMPPFRDRSRSDGNVQTRRISPNGSSTVRREPGSNGLRRERTQNSSASHRRNVSDTTSYSRQENNYKSKPDPVNSVLDYFDEDYDAPWAKKRDSFEDDYRRNNSGFQFNLLIIFR